MRLPIYQVDAFAENIFAGNPAAVCPLRSWLPTEILQRIARENNLSETVFFIPGNEPDHFELRWFTPAAEVDLCGHATLAVAWVLFFVHGSNRTLYFHTRAGTLTIRRQDDYLEMDFPALPLRPIPPAGDASAPMLETLSSALGAPAREVYAVRAVRDADDYLVVYDTVEQVSMLAPSADAIMRACGANVIVTAPTEAGEVDGEVDFVSRFFAPASGVDEDPVTGSSHCALAPYWAKRLGRNTLVGRQLSSRGGIIRCTIAGDRVILSGQGALYLRGEIILPNAYAKLFCEGTDFS